MIPLSPLNLLSNDELQVAIDNRQYPKVDVKLIESKIKSIQFYRIPDTTCITCIIIMDNNAVFSDISNCIDPRNYDELIGKTRSYQKTLNKVIDNHAYYLLESHHLSK